MLAIFLFPAALGISLAAEWLLMGWTGDASLARQVGPTVSLLVVATALHGVMYFPYSLQLAYGKTNMPLVINSILIVLTVPTTVVFTTRFGLFGAGMASLTLFIIYFLLGSWMTHRTLLRSTGWLWFLLDVGVPLTICTSVGLVVRPMLEGIHATWPWHVAGAACVSLGAMLLCVLASNHNLLQSVRHRFASGERGVGI
jgi:O-antigen/teichoic acid export membrane protein